jgi:serine/threonine-protein kinase
MELKLGLPMVMFTVLSTLACKGDSTADTDGSTSGDGDGDSTPTTTGDGDGTPGDGDGTPGDGDGSPTTTGDGDGTPGDGDGSPDLPACAGYFPADAIWCVDVTDAATTADSDTVIAWLEQAGWGNNDQFQIDFSIEVLEADANTPRMSFEATGDFYTPDCDYVEMPVPDGGAIEGEQGYECTSDGDCHLIVAARDEDLLYEMWRANIVNGTFYGGCLAVWDMTLTYGDDGRGQGCTSADAAGFPIAPLLFSADEVASGSIDHAIRFILPNANIRHFIYSPPATHSTGPTAGPDQAPPYGVHLRLRADYPLDDLPSEGARVVARALQTYGMFLADGGQIALTARSDRFTTNKWDGLLAPQDLVALRPMDFAVIDHGPLLDWGQQECTRTPLGTPP